MTIIDLTAEPPTYIDRETILRASLDPIIEPNDGIIAVSSIDRIARLAVPDGRWLPPNAVYSYIDLRHPCCKRSLTAPAGAQAAIRIHVFAPPPGTPVIASLVFLHGMNEWALRYAHFFEPLIARGIAVVAPDQPGVGRSEGSEGLVASVDDWVVSAVLAHRVRATRFPDAPPFVMGHSLGGLSATHLARLFPETRGGGVILCAPALVLASTSMTPGRALLLRMIPGVVRHAFALPAIPVVKLVSAPDEAYRSPSFHPLMSSRTTLQCVRAMFVGGLTAMRAVNYRLVLNAALTPEQEAELDRVCNSPKLHAPDAFGSDGEGSAPDFIGNRVFVLHGSSDPCCNWRGAWKLLAASGGPQWVSHDMLCPSGNDNFAFNRHTTRAVAARRILTSARTGVAPALPDSATPSPIPPHQKLPAAGAGDHCSEQARADRVWWLFRGYSHELLREPRWREMGAGVAAWIADKASRPEVRQASVARMHEGSLGVVEGEVGDVIRNLCTGGVCVPQTCHPHDAPVPAPAAAADVF